MKANVDKETCIGCGLCPSICDEVFGMDDDGKATVITDQVPDKCTDEVKDAESSCPVNAITTE
ncbi:MAG: ferredoxin [Clostridium sp.]